MGTGYAMREKSARDFLTPLCGGCTAHSSLMNDRVRPLSIHRPASKRGEFTGSTRTWWLRCDLRNGRRRVSCDSPAFKASEPTNAHATSCGNSRSRIDRQDKAAFAGGTPGGHAPGNGPVPGPVDPLRTL